MAGERVLYPIDDLRETSSQLTAIVEEFEAASARRDDLEHAVGRPDGDGRLKARVHDFEGSWNDSRDKLLTKLKEVAERVKGTVDEVTKTDRDMGNSIQQSGNGSGGRGRSVAN
jgi:phage-related minor tail protein